MGGLELGSLGYLLKVLDIGFSTFKNGLLFFILLVLFLLLSVPDEKDPPSNRPSPCCLGAAPIGSESGV
jgi:hypothetical protein